MRKSLIFSFVLIGITAISVQIILAREFLTVFYGNELSIVFILSIWLLGGAFGSGIASKIQKRKIAFQRDGLKSRDFAYFSNSQIMLSFFIPLSLFLTRITRIVFKINLGELISIPVMLLWAFVILMPICATLGFMFVIGCKLCKEKDENAEKKISITYLLESIGAALGGFITTLFLIRVFSNFEIAFILAFLNLLAQFLIIKDYLKEHRIRNLLRAALLISFVFFAVFGGIRNLDSSSLRLRWRGANLIEWKDSIYGNLVIAKIIDQYTFFSNGLHMMSAPDKLTAEEAVHFAMLLHAKPERVLLIGGGESEVLDEVLKYPIKKVTYVELNPLVILFAKRHLNKEAWFRLDDYRVLIENIDARVFVKNTDEHFDVVLINLPDPYTAQINRFYTIEFFKHLNKILNKRAIISFGIVSSENYISNELAEFLRSIYYTASEVFPEVKVLPGSTARFLISNEAGTISLNYNLLENQRIQKNIHTDFIRPYYLSSKLSTERVDYINKRLTPKMKKEGVFINRDFHPISYYYDMILWSTYQSLGLSKFFQNFVKIPIQKIFMDMLLFILFLAYILRNKKTYRTQVTLFALGTTGLSEMAFQILIILGFQIIYGYLYYKLGVIFTSFMIGLALGTYFIMHRLDRIRQLYTLYIKIQFMVLLYPLLLIAVFYFMSKAHSMLFKIGADMVFSSLPFIAGFVGGLQFPIANKIYLSMSKDVAKSAGTTYAIDLFGSCLGAIIISAFVIPLIGIYSTCIGVSLLNLVAFIALWFGKQR